MLYCDVVNMFCGFGWCGCTVFAVLLCYLCGCLCFSLYMMCCVLCCGVVVCLWCVVLLVVMVVCCCFALLYVLCGGGCGVYCV